MKKIITLLGILVFFVSVNALELIQLMDCPTAGILQKGEAVITAKLYKYNGLLLGTEVGLFPRFMFGVNYGAEQIVGNENPIWHERVEFNAKFRMFDESAKFPAFAIGFNSQGHGKYDSTQKKYDLKSKGFYGVMSKNYLFIGNLGFHLGGNYSLEKKDNDDEINFFLGLDKDLGEIFTFLFEYDFALNNNEDLSQNSAEDNVEIFKRGFLNGALNIHFSDSLSLKLGFYDLLRNRSDTKGCDRTLELLYNMKF